MSYCRCSSDDSNVYVFGCTDGWEIHVQASEQIDKSNTIRVQYDPEAYWNNWQDFPHELRAKSYFCATREECLAKLLELRKAGILVPNRALKRLRKEIKEDA